MTGAQDQTPPLLVKATINLPGLRRGETTEADRDSAYVQGCLAEGFLVPISATEYEAGSRG